MEALLRLVAMFLLNLAKPVRSKPSIPTAECDACQVGRLEADTPSDPIKEPERAAARSHKRPTPLMVESFARTGGS